jgi:hypothetical protein
MELVGHVADSRTWLSYWLCGFVICGGSCWTNSGVWRCGDAGVEGSCVPLVRS